MTAHFGVVVVVVVHVESDEGDSCSLVVGSLEMVVVVVEILGRLMVEEGMLLVNVSHYFEIVET